VWIYTDKLSHLFSNMPKNKCWMQFTLYFTGTDVLLLLCSTHLDMYNHFTPPRHLQINHCHVILHSDAVVWGRNHVRNFWKVIPTIELKHFIKIKPTFQMLCNHIQSWDMVMEKKYEMGRKIKFKCFCVLSQKFCLSQRNCVCLFSSLKFSSWKYIALIILMYLLSNNCYVFETALLKKNYCPRK